MADLSKPDAATDYVLTEAGRAAIAAHRQRVADRYVITAADGWIELWCESHTAGGSDFLGEWEGSPNQHSAAILAARSQHERERH